MTDHNNAQGVVDLDLNSHVYVDPATETEDCGTATNGVRRTEGSASGCKPLGGLVPSRFDPYRTHQPSEWVMLQSSWFPGVYLLGPLNDCLDYERRRVA